jgi:hypothetical protein
MRFAWVLSCLVLTVGGCVANRPGTDPLLSLGALREGELTLRIQALPQAHDVPHWLATQEALQSNDRFAIYVKSGKPLFLYVLSLPPKGENSTLYAASQASPLQSELRLPLEAGYFTLGNQRGRERISVIGTDRLLSAAQLEQYVKPAKGEKERDPETGKEEPEKEAPPPPVIPEGERNPRIVRALLGQDGIGMAQFDFMHQ